MSQPTSKKLSCLESNECNQILDHISTIDNVSGELNKNMLKNDHTKEIACNTLRLKLKEYESLRIKWGLETFEKIRNMKSQVRRQLDDLKRQVELEANTVLENLKTREHECQNDLVTLKDVILLQKKLDAWENETDPSKFNHIEHQVKNLSDFIGKNIEKIQQRALAYKSDETAASETHFLTLQIPSFSEKSLNYSDDLSLKSLDTSLATTKVLDQEVDSVQEMKNSLRFIRLSRIKADEYIMKRANIFRNRVEKKTRDLIEIVERRANVIKCEISTKQREAIEKLNQIFSDKDEILEKLERDFDKWESEINKNEITDCFDRNHIFDEAKKANAVINEEIKNLNKKIDEIPLFFIETTHNIEVFLKTSFI